jgi:hypothetical protein
VPIAARPAAPPRVSLIASADRPAAPLPEHWVNGITWVPELCLPESDSTFWWCSDADPESKGAIDSTPAAISYRPWIGWAGDSCSTFSVAERDLQGRAARRLQASLSRIIETELWTGTIAQAAGFPNAYLTDAATAEDLGTAGLMYALAHLQAYLAENVNERGMIHATHRTASLWFAGGGLRREGMLLLDPFDNIIVPGQGYDGSGIGGSGPVASGDTEYAFATSMVTVVIDNRITTNPPNLAEAIDRENNNIAYRAEQIVAAIWDVECAHAGIEVNLCEPCCEPTGS